MIRNYYIYSVINLGGTCSSLDHTTEYVVVRLVELWFLITIWLWISLISNHLSIQLMKRGLIILIIFVDIFDLVDCIWSEYWFFYCWWSIRVSHSTFARLYIEQGWSNIIIRSSWHCQIIWAVIHMVSHVIEKRWGRLYSTHVEVKAILNKDSGPGMLGCWRNYTSRFERIIPWACRWVIQFCLYQT